MHSARTVSDSESESDDEEELDGNGQEDHVALIQRTVSGLQSDVNNRFNAADLVKVGCHSQTHIIFLVLLWLAVSD